MARRADPRRTRTLYKAIERHPGRRRSFFARLLGWHRQKVERGLMHAEENGLLLYEDDEGHLWPYQSR